MSFQNSGIVDDLVAITLHDTNANNTMGFFVGVGGDVKITTANGTAVTLKNCPSGSWQPVATRLIWSTGTTATDLVGVRA